MTALVWDDRRYEYGVDRGVLYNENHTRGVAWNGLTSVDVSHPGAEFRSIYYDGIKYSDSVTAPDFQCTIKAFTWPIEFSACLGYTQVGAGFFVTAQPRTNFGLSYRTLRSDGGYKIHLIYNALVVPSSYSSTTISENAEPNEFQWDVDARPEYTEDYRPTAHFVVDSTMVTPETLQDLENILYGSDGLAVINGGTPKASGPAVISGGGPIEAAPVLIDGGSPFQELYAYPTLPPISLVMTVLEGV